MAADVESGPEAAVHARNGTPRHSATDALDVSSISLDGCDPIRLGVIAAPGVSRSERRTPLLGVCDVAGSAACAYVLQACEALAEAHAAGVVHRDLKPSNLFLCKRSDGSPLIKVIDFGLAKSLGPEQQVTLTNSGAPLGSLPFMAPEQMRGTADVDARADIYSLGATLYALLTGAPPFPGRSMLDVYDRIVAGVPLLRARGADVPAEVETAVQRSLQLSPEKRFANIAELAEALAPAARSHARLHAQRARGTLTAAANAANRPPTESESVTNAASASTAPPTSTGIVRESHPLRDCGSGNVPLAPPTSVGVTGTRRRSTRWLELLIGALLVLGSTVVVSLSQFGARRGAASSAGPVGPSPIGVTNLAPPTAPLKRTGTSFPEHALPAISTVPLAPPSSVRGPRNLGHPRSPSVPTPSVLPPHSAGNGPALLPAPTLAEPDPLADPN